MIRKAFIAGATLSFASAAAVAGGLNPPGVGTQMIGATATPSTTRAVATSTALAHIAASPEGAARLVAAITGMAGTRVEGNMITTPRITVGDDTVVLSMDMSSGIVSVMRTNGVVILQVKADIDRAAFQAHK